MQLIRTTSLILAAVTLTLLFSSCAIHPNAWEPQQKPAFAGVIALNEKLIRSEKISLDGWCGPEDIVFDSTGNMYCGAIKEHSNHLFHGSNTLPHTVKH
jgi:hypothetical protein